MFFQDGNEELIEVSNAIRINTTDFQTFFLFFYAGNNGVSRNFQLLERFGRSPVPVAGNILGRGI